MAHRQWMKSALAAGVGAMMLCACGCAPEKTPTGEQLKEQRQLKRQAVGETPKVIAPESRNVNEAQLVLDACGKPLSESVIREYDNNMRGPVLRMTYNDGRTVTLDFVPKGVMPAAAGSKRPAAAPVGQTWEFDEASAGVEQLLTAGRLAPYLPCAAQALSRYE